MQCGAPAHCRKGGAATGLGLRRLDQVGGSRPSCLTARSASCMQLSDPCQNLLEAGSVQPARADCRSAPALKKRPDDSWPAGTSAQRPRRQTARPPVSQLTTAYPLPEQPLDPDTQPITGFHARHLLSGADHTQQQACSHLEPCRMIQHVPAVTPDVSGWRPSDFSNGTNLVKSHWRDQPSFCLTLEVRQQRLQPRRVTIPWLAVPIPRAHEVVST